MAVLYYQFKVYLPYCHSLKEKRGIIKPFQSRLRKNFNISIAEIGLNDIWQNAIFGISMVSNQRNLLEKQVSVLKKFVEEHFPEIILLEEQIEIW